MGLIRSWMEGNVHRFVDEQMRVDVQLMVKIWDQEVATGRATLNLDHIAWDIGIAVAARFEADWRKKQSKRQSVLLFNGVWEVDVIADFEDWALVG